jgi:hypothetical protein
VAAALANGQVEVDASVTELRPPNAPIGEPATALAPVLESTQELRAAGEGRFSAAAASHLVTGADENEADHGHDESDADHDESEAGAVPPEPS